MSKDINLLPDITLKEERESKQQKLLTIVSMAILIIGIVGIIAAFTVDITYTKNYEKISAENLQKGKEILDYAETESYQRAIKSKLTTAGNIMKEAKDFKTIIENIQSMLPETGISISDITIDKANKIGINARAENAESFKSLVRNLLDQEKGGKYFDEVALGTISTSREGTLQFNIGMNLKKTTPSSNAPAITTPTDPVEPPAQQ